MLKAFGLLMLGVSAAAAMTVTVAASLDSPQPLGKIVRFTATADGGDASAMRYRLRVRTLRFGGARDRVDEPYQTIVDFGLKSEWEWTTIDREGELAIEVTARNLATGEAASEVIPFTFTRIATDGPVVTPTAHPLVFVYSAPPCPAGNRMRVRFAGPDAPTFTPYRDCNGRYSMNFYLAGMRPSTEYTARHTFESPVGVPANAPDLTFTTGSATISAPAAFPLSTPLPPGGGILLHGIVNGNTIATDLNGNMVWYGPSGLTFFTRANPGGTFLSLFEDGAQDSWHQFLREFDLAGVTRAETNAGRVNEQLAAIGRRPITSFHHEAIRLSNGDYLVLAGNERVLTNVQGAGPVDVLGDVILVLDRDLQVRWYWDAFDHLDPARRAVLDETCTYPATVACSAFYGAKTANDWLHGNSLQLTPDGDILYSVRHQDWVVKIDYRNGAGTGAIEWRLGAGGDFDVSGGGEHPWFSHQHDAQFLSDNHTMMLFDNGNTRIAKNSGETTSRGQVWMIDEKARTATVVMNADLKQNSAALGTAELLDNGNYHFDAGFIQDPANPSARFAQAIETDAAGGIVWGMQVAAQVYRSVRMKDLYSPPRP